MASVMSEKTKVGEHVGINLIRIVVLAVVIISIGSLSAYASADFGGAIEGTVTQEVKTIEKVSIESVLDQFDLELTDIAYKQETSLDYSFGEYVSPININRFSSFVLSSGFDRMDSSTFASEKNLVGQGDQGMTVGVLVYTKSRVAIVEEDMTRSVDYKTVYDLVFSSVKELGASGLYNESVYFSDRGEQYVTVMVRSEDGRVMNRTFRVTTVKEKTKNILENIEIKFIDEEPVKLNTDTNSFMDWFGLSQEIGF